MIWSKALSVFITENSNTAWGRRKVACIVNRPDLESFTAGSIYLHEISGELVEFIGIATVSGLAGEDVAVFRFVDGSGCLIATNRDYQQGDVFTPYGDAIEEALELEE
jgi:hypothetical protein